MGLRQCGLQRFQGLTQKRSSDLPLIAPDSKSHECCAQNACIDVLHWRRILKGTTCVVGPKKCPSNPVFQYLAQR